MFHFVCWTRRCGRAVANPSLKHLHQPGAERPGILRRSLNVHHSSHFSSSSVSRFVSFKCLSSKEGQTERKNGELETNCIGARTLLGAPGLTTRNKKLLGVKGIATTCRSKQVEESFDLRLWSRRLSAFAPKCPLVRTRDFSPTEE